MYSFKDDILDGLAGHEVTRALGFIHETRGKQELCRQRKVDVLGQLQQLAVVESTISSNRLEGIVVSQAAMDRIMSSGLPLNASDRFEAEVAGYRRVLGWIHEDARNIPLASGVIRRVHRDLTQLTADGGGQWKKVPNSISIHLPDDTRALRAETTDPDLVGVQIDGLIARFEDRERRGRVDPLILIALFILDFLCIHPFSDGNGRVSRLLTVLLLYRHRYLMVGYVSLERIIEETKTTYYETLHRSDQGWHDAGSHDPRPWVEYFLGVLVKACHEFMEKVESISSAPGVKRSLVIAAIDETIGWFSISDLGRKCSVVGRDTIRLTLRHLKDAGFGFRAESEVAQDGQIALAILIRGFFGI